VGIPRPWETWTPRRPPWVAPLRPLVINVVEAMGLPLPPPPVVKEKCLPPPPSLLG
jgi:hypothetical protein